MRIPTRSAAVLALACVSSACASIPNATSFSRDRGGVDVVVENHAWTDLSVYARTGSGNQRLGHVTSGRTATFRIPSMANRVMDVELFADPLASSDLHRSGRFIVSEGQRVVWTVHENRLGGELTIR